MPYNVELCLMNRKLAGPDKSETISQSKPHQGDRWTNSILGFYNPTLHFSWVS